MRRGAACDFLIIGFPAVPPCPCGESWFQYKASIDLRQSIDVGVSNGFYACVRGYGVYGRVCGFPMLRDAGKMQGSVTGKGVSPPNGLFDGLSVVACEVRAVDGIEGY